MHETWIYDPVRPIKLHVLQQCRGPRRYCDSDLDHHNQVAKISVEEKAAGGPVGTHHCYKYAPCILSPVAIYSVLAKRPMYLKVYLRNMRCANDVKA